MTEQAAGREAESMDAESKRSVPTLQATGERLVPESSDPRTFWEHVLRYRFACGLSGGLRVLDVACGEGYGTAALAAVAGSVVGVDVSPEAVEHARRKYGVDARVGDAAGLPIDDASCDLVVSFETIEHVADPAGFLGECARALKPAGRLVISTPERQAYRQDDPEGHNPFHQSELTVGEFKSLLGGHFVVDDLYGQTDRGRPRTQAVFLASGHLSLSRYRGGERLRRFLDRRLRRETERAKARLPDLLAGRVAVPWFVRPLGLRPLRSDSSRPTYVVAVATKRR